MIDGKEGLLLVHTLQPDGRLQRFARSAGRHLLNFLFILGFVTGFQLLFGAENTLIGVAIGVGLTMFPAGYTGVRRGTAGGMIFGLYVAAVLVGQCALLPLWLALPAYALFTVLLLAVSMEPDLLKPSVTFLLCFVFAQSAPVPWERLPLRLAGTACAAGVTALVTMLAWRRRGQGGADARGLREQIACSVPYRGYILRMALGLTAAMGIAAALGLHKPLWLSIVVMSLTQIEPDEMFPRMKYRALGTLIGAAVFCVLFLGILPDSLHGLAILVIGYLSYFAPAYRYKQIVNTISALYASMTLLQVPAAVCARMLCFAGGLAIVLALYGLGRLCTRRQQPLGA